GGYDTTQNQSNNIIAGQGINLKGADFQGGLIANKDISVDTTSKMIGPMISVYRTVNAGQTNVLTFPPILFAPSGESIFSPSPPRPRRPPPRRSTPAPRPPHSPPLPPPNIWGGGRPGGALALPKPPSGARARQAAAAHLRARPPPIVRGDGMLEPLPGFDA